MIRDDVFSGLFRQYDFGETQNLIKYGTKEPPKYNFNAISSQIAIYYAHSDMYTKPKVSN